MMIKYLLFRVETPDYDFFRIHTETLTQRQNAIFTLFCAESVFHLDPNELSRICLDLVRKRLVDENSATKEELAKVAYAPLTSWLAHYAAVTACSHDGHPIYAAAGAVHAVADSTADPNITDRILAFLSMLTTAKIPQTPYTDPLEILVYLTDIMDFPILVQEDNKFKLNLWHKDYKFQVCGEIQDIAVFCEDNFVLG